MKYRKLTDSNDYSFGLGDDEFFEDAEAIAQAIKTKLLLFYGEWWENISIGMPLFESVLGQVNNEQLKVSFALLIEKRILEVDGVNSVQSIEIEVEKRKITAKVSVMTSSGEVEVEVGF